MNYSRIIINILLLSQENLFLCLLYSFPLAFLTNSSQMGLTLKSRRDERPQTGAQAPGSSATTKEVLKGRKNS